MPADQTTDIVSRLRASQPCTRQSHDLNSTAADEIKRLRSQLARIVEHYDMAAELYISDRDLAEGLATIARKVLLEDDE